MFKNFLLIIMTLEFALQAFAQEPKETVEYWKAKAPASGISNNKFNEASSYMKKCWDETQMYFTVKKDSKEWNICCAIYAAANNMTLEEAKQSHEQSQKEAKENPELLEMFK